MICIVKTVLQKCSEKHYDNVPKESIEEISDKWTLVYISYHTHSSLLQLITKLGPFNSVGVETWVECENLCLVERKHVLNDTNIMCWEDEFNKIGLSNMS